ncbi:hypothetical protein [Pseudobacteriovorax antillogorgiicola]|uniref:Uncharacterized protein n=1 Tax=Pseudobacteriovorax antillogorgiicola TaxID=1513793 RepID=A0A1Y6C9P8_9BACT|nr:hypothetical protein [Pseudobacteriovorax antillogorgiicola]TCS49001.1 hypothetical protein EDD56_11643 [Pseudobacteriovorax antillogorgiicola]SMF53264.1 hypothetical protein SAMN06296036_116111 [Pseudobacteriovorax antillogorgiicola]
MKRIRLLCALAAIAGAYTSGFAQEGYRRVVLGEVVSIMEPPPPGLKDNDYHRRYEAHLREKVIPRVQEIYACAHYFTEMETEFRFWNDIVIGSSSEQKKSKANLYHNVEKVSAEKSNFQRDYDAFLLKWESKARSNRVGMEDIESFEKAVVKIIDANIKVSDLELATIYLMRKHRTFLSEYMDALSSEVFERVCGNPANVVNGWIGNFKRRHEKYKSTLNSFFDDFVSVREKRLQKLSNVITQIRFGFRESYAQSQGRSFENLSAQLKQSIEIFKVGEEIYHWGKKLAFQGYANRYDTVDLYYTGAVETLKRNKNRALDYTTVVKSYGAAPQAAKDKYLNYLKSRIKFIDHNIQKVERMGWKGFLDRQKLYVEKSLELVDRYPKGCKEIFESFLEEAKRIKTKSQFLAIETLYSSNKKKCKGVAR